MGDPQLRRAYGAYRIEDLLGRARHIYRASGPRSLFGEGYRFASSWATELALGVRYRLEYGPIAPAPGERMRVDPERIEYVMGQRHVHDDAPPFGVLEGSWDREKKHRFDDVEVWGGLRERFEEGLPWEETRYYQVAVNRLRRGEPLRLLDAEERSVETFEAYLSEVDDLYRSIRTEGFDETAVVPVNVGRDGEWILYGDGNHRTTIAQAVGVDSIPVCIVYRHEQWQDVRQDVHDADAYDELSPKATRNLDHPDVRDAMDGPLLQGE